MGEADWISGLPDLNHNDRDVVRCFIKDILDWVEQAEINAIRMDTVLYVERHVRDEFKVTIRSKYPDVSLVGEVLDYDVDETLIEQIEKERAPITIKDGHVQLQLSGETSAIYKLP